MARSHPALACAPAVCGAHSPPRHPSTLARPPRPRSFHTCVRVPSAGRGNTATPRILVTGALGQIGLELVRELGEMFGRVNVIATDLRPAPKDLGVPFRYACVNRDGGRDLERIVVEHDINWIVHNASILSAAGEQNPELCLDVNFNGFRNALEVAKKYGLRILAPSSIAAFGPTTPRDLTADLTIMRPTTLYGISKVYTELLGEYYHQRYSSSGLDFRSLRYPGIISHIGLPGGGTTDYAVDIYYKALQHGKFESFLSEDTVLPMMYMEDCVRATVELLTCPDEKLSQRTYNVAAVSFSPKQQVESVKKEIPHFEATYNPDFRQAIADTWPKSLDDTKAREDWGWNHHYGLDEITKDMLHHLRRRFVYKPVNPKDLEKATGVVEHSDNVPSGQ